MGSIHLSISIPYIIAYIRVNIKNTSASILMKINSEYLLISYHFDLVQFPWQYFCYTFLMILRLQIPKIQPSIFCNEPYILSVVICNYLSWVIDMTYFWFVIFLNKTTFIEILSLLICSHNSKIKRKIFLRSNGSGSLLCFFQILLHFKKNSRLYKCFQRFLGGITVHQIANFIKKCLISANKFHPCQFRALNKCRNLVIYGQIWVKSSLNVWEK